jgi:restriction system protein
VAVWTVKGGRHGEREERLLQRGLIGGGWEELPDLSSIDSFPALRTLLEETYPDFSKNTINSYVGQLWSLRARMQNGEFVVLPLKTSGTIAVGRITGDYEYLGDAGNDIQHVRRVEWLKTDIPRDAFDQDLLYSFGAYLTFGQVQRDLAEERVAAVLKGTQPPSVAPADKGALPDQPPPDVEAIAREQVRQYISRTYSGHDFAALIGDVLGSQGFVVTVSPPGADQGVDIMAGSAPMGLGHPRIIVQVKKGQAGVDEFRSLSGLVTRHDADYGLLVAWGGFKGTVRSEAKGDHFRMRLWDSEDVLSAIFDSYELLPDDVRSGLPLQRVWALVPESD